MTQLDAMTAVISSCAMPVYTPWNFWLGKNKTLSVISVKAIACMSFHVQGDLRMKKTEMAMNSSIKIGDVIRAVPVSYSGANTAIVPREAM